MNNDPNWEELATALVTKRFDALSQSYLQTAADHINAIGALSKTDFYRLSRMRDIGADMSAIKTEIATQTALTLTDLESLFSTVATQSMQVYDGLTDIAEYRYNELAGQLITAQFWETSQTLLNLSQTTVYSQTYQNLIDRAVTAVQVGTEDYASAIRSVLRQTASEGLCININGSSKVQYASGYKRRIDTAVRQNVLDGARALFARMSEETGKAFGSDGVELSAHMLCATDHLPYQGRQFANDAYQSLQQTLKRAFTTWNCKHVAMPIILGISEPTYTEEELETYRQNSTELITIDGKTRTRYEWSQVQRKLETAVRAQKDVANLAKASGDDFLRREAQAKINAYTKQYEAISSQAGLELRKDKMTVSGFRAVSKGVQDLSALRDKSGGVGYNASNQEIASLFQSAIALPDGTASHLTTGSTLIDVEIFAGKGSTKELRVRNFLVDNYGGTADEWQHTKARGFVEVGNESKKAVIHWFYEESVGVKEAFVKGWSKK